MRLRLHKLCAVVLIFAMFFVFSRLGGSLSGIPFLQPASSSQADACPAALLPFANCLTPHMLRLAYGVESLIDRGYTGKGQTVVVIVTSGSPTLQQDLDAFDAQFGLPPVTVQTISPLHVGAYDPLHDLDGWAKETELDVQVIHAIAPGAGIVVLSSPVAETEGTIGLPEFLQLEQYAIGHHLGNIISQSWGVSEATLGDPQGQSVLQTWDAFFQRATTRQAITFFAASGDRGATDYADVHETKLSPRPTTNFPADDPWVTGCGGTTLAHQGTSFQEAAWSGSGGGFSQFSPRPGFQPPPPLYTKLLTGLQRGVPDVSADADPKAG